MPARSLMRFSILSLVAASMAAQVHAAQRVDDSPVRNFQLTSERVQSFGKFTAIETASLRPGGVLHIYGEPGEFGWHRHGEVNTFSMTVSAQLRRSDGRAVVGNVAPLVLKKQSADRPREFFFSLSLNISASVGLYTIGITLRDPVNGQTIKRSFPVQVSHRPQPSIARVHGSAPARDVDRPSPDEAMAEPSKCGKYFGQIGAMVNVPCGR